jgi:hypothetical protein
MSNVTVSTISAPAVGSRYPLYAKFAGTTDAKPWIVPAARSAAALAWENMPFAGALAMVWSKLAVSPVTLGLPDALYTMPVPEGSNSSAPASEL